MVAAAGSLVTKMVIAAFSGMGGATFTHPFDVIRVQMQTEGSEYKNIVDAGIQIYKREGFVRGLYAGVDAAYLRQWLYGSCRIGIYAYLLDQARQGNIASGYENKAIPLSTKMLMGAISGGLGSFVGTPADVALVRMSNDSKLPVSQRRYYKNVVDCISRISREEGILHLWTGARVTVLRAIVLSACVLAFTSQIKMKLTESGIFGEEGQNFQGFPLMLCATVVSSFIATLASNPFDVVKSRIQNQQARKDGSKEYNSMIQAFIKIVSEEGIWKLWAGFFPAFVKQAPKQAIELTLADKITLALTGKCAL